MDDSKEKPQEVIDLVGENDNGNDSVGIGGESRESDVPVDWKTTAKRRLTGKSSKELPSDAEVIDLVDDGPAFHSSNPSTRTANPANDKSLSKNTRKRPRYNSDTQEKRDIANDTDIVDLVDSSDDLLLSGSNASIGNDGSNSNIGISNHDGGSRNKRTSTETDNTRVHQAVILETSDTAKLTTGIMERIYELSIASHNKCWTCLGRNRTLRSTQVPTAVFGAPAHIQQTETWSCGYRNYQMLLSALLPRLFDSPNHFVFQKLARRLAPTPISLPSVLQIQASMEDAWNDEGFDPDGARHYRHSICNKKGNAAKIGAMEVANVCWYHGIDAVVIQCVKCAESRNLLPYIVWAYFAQLYDEEEGPNLARKLLSEATRWSKRPVTSVVNLIDAMSGVSSNVPTVPPLLPLYLQWEGHSVTVVGIEIACDPKTSKSSSLSAKLVVLDPMKKTQKIQSDLQSSESIVPSSVTIPWNQISNKDLQIIVSTRRSMSYSERQSCKSQNGKNCVPPRGRVLTAAEDAVQRYLLRQQR